MEVVAAAQPAITSTAPNNDRFCACGHQIPDISSPPSDFLDLARVPSTP